MVLYDEEGEESGDEESSELLGFAKTAFPDQEWDEPRLEAFKKLIKGCSGYMGKKDDDDSEDEDTEAKGKSDSGAGLALVFGEPKSKKK